MHQSGATPEAVSASLADVDKLVTRERQKEQAIDQQLKQTTQAAYQREWGDSASGNTARTSQTLTAHGASADLVADVREAMSVNPELGRVLLKLV